MCNRHTRDPSSLGASERAQHYLELERITSTAYGIHQLAEAIKQLTEAYPSLDANMMRGLAITISSLAGDIAWNELLGELLAQYGNQEILQ